MGWLEDIEEAKKMQSAMSQADKIAYGNPVTQAMQKAPIKPAPNVEEFEKALEARNQREAQQATAQPTTQPVAPQIVDKNQALADKIAQNDANKQAQEALVNKQRIERVQGINERNPDSVGTQPRYTPQNDVVTTESVPIMGTKFVSNPLKAETLLAKKNLQGYQDSLDNRVLEIERANISPQDKERLKKEALAGFTKAKMELGSKPDFAFVGNTKIDRLDPSADRQAWEAYNKLNPDKAVPIPDTGKVDPFPWGEMKNDQVIGTDVKETGREKSYDMPTVEPEAVKAIEQEATGIKKDPDNNIPPKTPGEWDWLAGLGRGALFLLNAYATGQGSDPAHQMAYQEFQKLGQQDKENAMKLAELDLQKESLKQSGSSAVDKVRELEEKAKQAEIQRSFDAGEAQKERDWKLQYLAQSLGPEWQKVQNDKLKQQQEKQPPPLAQVLEQYLK